MRVWPPILLRPWIVESLYYLCYDLCSSMHAVRASQWSCTLTCSAASFKRYKVKFFAWQRRASESNRRIPEAVINCDRASLGCRAVGGWSSTCNTNVKIKMKSLCFFLLLSAFALSPFVEHPQDWYCCTLCIWRTQCIGAHGVFGAHGVLAHT